MEKKKLRFAALIRVSTEKQAEQGSSLQTQRKQLEQAVHFLSGSIVEWYGGQEHATPGWEKKEVDRLLRNAQKKHKPFDAVIVQNADRWSRDNEAGERGLTTLKTNKVRFFVGSSEYDLFNPEHRLFLTMSTAFGSFQARHQSKKSIENRIERAKQGIPSAGKLPYGRIFDRETNTWSIDPDKQKIIKDVAKRYLAGESMPVLAEEYSMNHSNLNKILTQRSGTSWTCSFQSKDLGIHEEVEIQIPALLSQKTIQRIKRQVENNKTYYHGEQKNHYLLSSVIFCSECGYAMFGQTNKNGNRYYRHAHSKRGRPCTKQKYWVRCNDIEDAVMRHLFHAFGNPEMIEEALKRAIPDIERQKELEEKRDRLQKQLDRVKQGRKKIVKLLSDGKLSDEDVETQLDASAKKSQKLQSEIESITVELLQANTVSLKDIERVAKSVRKYKTPSKARVRLIAAKDVSKSSYAKMTYKQKRALIKQVFSGDAPDGRRYGIYVDLTDPEGQRKGKSFKFQILGHFIELTDRAPIDEGSAEFLTDPNYAHGEHQEGLVDSASYYQSISSSI